MAMKNNCSPPNQCPVSPQAAVPSQLPPLVYTESMKPHSREYPFGHLGSTASAVVLSTFCAPSASSLVEQCEEQKRP